MNTLKISVVSIQFCVCVFDFPDSGWELSLLTTPKINFRNFAPKLLISRNRAKLRQTLFLNVVTIGTHIDKTSHDT